MNQPRQRDRRPEELDEVVAQLNNLGGLGLPGVGGAGRRDEAAEGGRGQGVGKEKVFDVPQRPLIMEDDEDDEGVAPASDGTLLASTPARPLSVSLSLSSFHSTLCFTAVDLALGMPVSIILHLYIVTVNIIIPFSALTLLSW